MKILLDHNTPHQLRGLLSDHEVHTAAYLGWSEFENGELLEAAASHGYDVLITCDQGISNEQNPQPVRRHPHHHYERRLDRHPREYRHHPTGP